MTNNAAKSATSDVLCLICRWTDQCGRAAANRVRSDLSAGKTAIANAIFSLAHRHGLQSMVMKKKKNAAFKIRIRGKDDTPLSMTDLRQGLYEIARKLEPYEKGYRAKWSTLYLTLIDEDGEEVRINDKGEWTIRPYRTAADDYKA